MFTVQTIHLGSVQRSGPAPSPAPPGGSGRIVKGSGGPATAPLRRGRFASRRMVAPYPIPAPRGHASLGYCSVKMGHLDGNAGVDRRRRTTFSPSRSGQPSTRCSAPPRGVSRDQCSRMFSDQERPFLAIGPRYRKRVCSSFSSRSPSSSDDPQPRSLVPGANRLPISGSAVSFI